MNTNQPRPVLKWAGGKSQLLPQLLERLPNFTGRYHEPFIGGGALFFELNLTSSRISDLNPRLIGMYRTIRDLPVELGDALRSFENTFNSLDPDGQSELYYSTRLAFNARHASPLEEAAQFIFLNKSGFNGLFRENSAGDFNVPFSRRTKLTLFDEANLTAVSNLLLSTELDVATFEHVLEHAGEGDFVYFDPPYVPIPGSPSFTSYLRGGFGPDMQIRLSKVFDELDRNGVHVMLSNSNTATVNDLFKKHRIDVVRANRNISSNSKTRTPVEEVIVTNY